MLSWYVSIMPCQLALCTLCGVTSCWATSSVLAMRLAWRIGLITCGQAFIFVCLSCTVRRSESALCRQSESRCNLARSGSIGDTIGVSTDVLLLFF